MRSRKRQEVPAFAGMTLLFPTLTHAVLTEETQFEAGIKTTLLRLSMGIEHTPDLISDISAALACASGCGELRLSKGVLNFLPEL